MSEREEDPRSLEDWLRGALHDSALWPVLIAAFGILATLGASMLLMAFARRNPFAMAAVAILAVVSGREGSRAWRRGRRIGPGAVALLWGLSGLGAVVALHWLPR